MSFQGMIRTGDMRNAKAEEYTDANDAARHIQVSESAGGFTGPSEAHVDLRRSRGQVHMRYKSHRSRSVFKSNDGTINTPALRAVTPPLRYTP